MRLDKLLAITVLLVISTMSVAASPAAMTIFPEESSTQINSFTSYEVEIENVGTVKDVYTLSSKSSQVSIAPREVSLDTGEQETVNVWYNPSQKMEAGTYGFTITATSRGTGQSYSVDGTVEVIKDHEVSVSVEDRSRTACLGEQVTYEVEVTNEGLQKEEFAVSTGFGQLSKTSVTLEDGETQTVRVTASADTAMQKNFNVVAASKTSYAESIANLDFESVVCYDSDVSATPGSQEVAAETEAEYEITVRNTGTKMDVFTLSTSRGELDDTQLVVDGKSTDSTTLSYTPSELGERQITVTAKGNSQSSATVTADVYNGMNHRVSFDSQSRSVCERGTATYTVTVTNTGEADETYRLQANTGELEDTEIDVDTGDSEEVELTVSAQDRDTGTTRDIRVTATADTFDAPQKTATSQFTVENCWDLKMNVVPKVASAGENRSVIYEVHLTNTGTMENTYTVTKEGPSWVSIKPDELEIASGESKTAYMYAGIPFEKEGQVKIEVTSEGNNVRRSQTVDLVIGEDLRDAIRSERDRLTGSFSRLVSDISETVTSSSNAQKILASIVIGLAISLVVLYSEW